MNRMLAKNGVLPALVFALVLSAVPAPLSASAKKIDVVTSTTDMAALTQEVRKKRLRCALDVTDPIEPLPVNHPLRNLPGAVVTPHVAGGSRQVRRQMAETVMDDLENFFQGKPVVNRVTRQMLQRMT